MRDMTMISFNKSDSEWNATRQHEHQTVPVRPTERHHTTVVDEVSRRRRATYRRRFTTMFGAADAASPSATGDMTACEDDELDDDENFLRERAKCRLERLQMQQKKTRKRTPRRYLALTLTVF